MELRNASLQRDSSLVTRWWSLKLMLNFFMLATRHGVYFDGANAVSLAKTYFLTFYRFKAAI